MTVRRWLWAAPVATAVGLGIWADAALSAKDEAVKQGGDPKAAVTLPIKQVVLFNSGVGYFGRSGEVEGDARVDLAFPETDVNDLLKSMTLQDFDKGHISAVSYDSREPVARTLSSFAINLTAHPSLGQILTQARGEKVEVVMQPAAGTAQPGTLQGTVVGLEVHKLPAGQSQVDAEMLNVLTADGLRCVKLSDVQRVRFTNPLLEAELKRALDVLALAHDTQKKAVSVSFSGEGKRRVKVGYVIEAPVWKTSYRLVLDKEEKPYLQGWAVVENQTDEDWAQVRMALVSGRPISFKMNLYDPLYVPRPTVEPELFASLRPPAYEGGFVLKGLNSFDNPKAVGYNPAMGGFNGRVASGKGDAKKLDKAKQNLKDTDEGEDSLKVTSTGKPNSYGFSVPPFGTQDRQLAADMAARMDLSAVQSAATASKLGDYFQYTLQHPVSLARQKSALLPIVGKDVEGVRVSIYNPGVQAKHPLLGFRFKNTTGVNLNQGPVTVLEGSTYAGDARIQDVPTNDERMIAYAVDLGTEVIPQNGPGSSPITSVKAQKGIVHITRRVREEKVYKVSNKNDADRTLVIEHPNRTNQQFKLVSAAKPIEETAALYRFETKVAAGKSAEFVVAEEKDQGEQVVLTNAADETVRFVINLGESTPALKGKLGEALKLKGAWDVTRRDLNQVATDIARISGDQERLRKNLRETPEKSDLYKTYLDKLTAQEKEMDGLTAKQKALMTDEFKTRKGYEDYLGNLSD